MGDRNLSEVFFFFLAVSCFILLYLPSPGKHATLINSALFCLWVLPYKSILVLGLKKVGPEVCCSQGWLTADTQFWSIINMCHQLLNLNCIIMYVLTTSNVLGIFTASEGRWSFFKGLQCRPFVISISAQVINFFSYVSSFRHVVVVWHLNIQLAGKQERALNRIWMP